MSIDVPWGIRLEAEPAQRVGPIITGGERPWEVNGIWVNTLMHDEGKYRLWGIGQDEKPWSEGGDEKGNRLACYLESDDCKTWRRPSLGCPGIRPVTPPVSHCSPATTASSGREHRACPC